MNAHTKTFNFPFRGTENHQAYISRNVRKTLDTTFLPVMPQGPMVAGGGGVHRIGVTPMNSGADG
jgi:hypothetical protein